MDIIFLTIITTVFLIAGLVKGVIGLGLPTVSLALLTILFDLPQAMILMIVPSFVTNLWQAFVGEPVVQLLKHQWQFFLFAVLTIFIGAQFLLSSAVAWFPALLGALLCVYALLGMSGYKLALTKNNQPLAGTICGLLNGFLTGMTGSFVVPGVLYLQSIGFKKDKLIQSMGILFTLSTIMLAVSLSNLEIHSAKLSLYSAYAIVPALIGMRIGQKIRKTISEQVFRKLFYISLSGLGLSLILKTTVF